MSSSNANYKDTWNALAATEESAFAHVAGYSDEQRLQESTVITLAWLRQMMREFLEERQWHKYHQPRNLAARISVEAGELLEQVFQDHPDAPFLDAMLLKWVLVAYSSGDYPKAREKCAQLLFEYPGSAYAEKARQVLPKIEARLKADTGAGEKTP